MISDKEKFYSKVANQFDDLMNRYDLDRRLKIVFQRLLPEDISNKKILDAGCGNGWFSRMAIARGSVIYSLDISYEMLQSSQSRFSGRFINGSSLVLPFKDSQFDIIISSEMIEHTPNPFNTVAELARVLKPGGTLIITTPNHVWQWLVDLSSWLRIRPFNGIENFVSFYDLERYFIENNLIIQNHLGFHPWPFQISFLQPISAQIDTRFGNSLWGRFMINQAIKAIK